LAEVTVAAREAHRWTIGIAAPHPDQPGRRAVLSSADDAVARIPDGAVVGLGGAVTAGHPMTLVRALARRQVRDLTLVAVTGGIEVDLLIASGCVSKVAGAYVGVESVAGVGPVFRRAVEAGEVEVIELDEAHCVMGLRAAGHGLPFLPWRGGVGTDFTRVNPSLVAFDDPVRGEPLLAVPALELDFALIYAEAADAYGNAQVVGTGAMDNLLGNAAERVIVQADRIVSTETVRADPGRTWFWPETTVVHAPFGTHPYSNAWMIADEEHLVEFAAASRGGDLPAWLERYVHGPATHEDYLEAIGIRRIVSLLV
jgi:glutaconate CoA-transferase subunit A